VALGWNSTKVSLTRAATSSACYIVLYVVLYLPHLCMASLLTALTPPHPPSLSPPST
jgi:hypothetical protein